MTGNPGPWPLPLLGLLLFSLLCRLVLIHCKDGVGTDEVIYLALGRNLWHGLGFRLLDQPITMCPPLLPLLSGFFSLFTDNLELGSNFVYVVFGTALVAPYYELARRLWGERVGWLASFLLAFYPGLLLSFYWGSMTEALYTFLLITALLFLHRGLGAGRPLDFCLTGLFLGLLYLCRSEGVLFFPVLMGFALLAGRLRRAPAARASVASPGHAHGPAAGSLTPQRDCRGDLTKSNPSDAPPQAHETGAPTGPGDPCGRSVPTLPVSVRNLALMALCFVLVAAPYPLFLKKHSGSISLSGKTKLILLAGAMPLEQRERLMGRLNEEGTTFVDYEALVQDRTVTGMILENPMVLLGGSVLQVRNFLVTLFSWKVFPVFLLPFALLGLVRGLREPGGKRRELFLVASCLPFLVFLTFRIWPRYLLPMTPLLLLWTARGVILLGDGIRSGAYPFAGWSPAARRRARLLPAAFVALPLLVILVAKPVKARFLVQYPVEYRQAGAWMRANLPPDALILARKPEIAYYADRMMHPLPNEELPRVIAYARARGIGTLVVDEYFIATRPQLRFLLEEERFPEDLSLRFEARAPNGRKIRVFEIRPDPRHGIGPESRELHHEGKLAPWPRTPEARRAGATIASQGRGDDLG